MESAQKLKKELRLNIELVDLLDVLKGMAASEFRALERQKRRFVEFHDAFAGFFRMIDFSTITHPFASDFLGKLGIIMVTSDEGFMGGLNTRVIQTALNLRGADSAELIVIGERGAGYLRGLGRDFVEFPGIASNERYETSLKIRDFIMKEALGGRFSRLLMVYPKPISFTVQHTETLTILPCSELFHKTEKPANIIKHLILESSVDHLIEYLLGTWIAYKLYEVFEDSKLAEFSARTVHLEESHQVLSRRTDQVQYQYFRSHHEHVDRSMREMFSSRLIRKKKKKD